MRNSIVVTIYLFCIIATTMGQMIGISIDDQVQKNIDECLRNYKIEGLIDRRVKIDELTPTEKGCAHACYYKSINSAKNGGSADWRNLVDRVLSEKVPTLVSECRAELDDCAYVECIHKIMDLSKEDLLKMYPGMKI